MDDEADIKALMETYNLSRDQAEEVLALDDNPLGDVQVIEPKQAPDTGP